MMLLPLKLSCNNGSKSNLNLASLTKCTSEGVGDKNYTSGDLINCISCVNIKVNENNDGDHIRALIFLVKLVHIARGSGAGIE